MVTRARGPAASSWSTSISFQAGGDPETSEYMGPARPAVERGDISFTRAITATSTRAAPADFRARQQPSAVAPVVRTSSIRRIRRPAILRRHRSGTLNTPATFRRRPDPDLPPWLWVARVRTTGSGRYRRPASLASGRAI